jgi:FRG domain
MTTTEVGITSPEWGRFLEAIKESKAALGNPEILWYRGHPTSEFYLLASLLRYENGIQKEKLLFDSFRKFSDRILKRRDSEWETLFEMQHYGVPTRLLDWSETFGIALFFATTYNQSRHSDQDAAIYLLDPLALNRISGIHQIFRVPQDETKFSYTKIYWDHTPFAATAPIAIEPIFLNDRMLAQRGMFTVHHDKVDPIERVFPQAIRKVTLPNSTIPAAAEFLELSNVTIFSVFPDLAGLSDYLKSTTGLHPRR